MSELPDHPAPATAAAPAVIPVMVQLSSTSEPAAANLVPEIVSDQPVKKVIKGIMKNGGSSHQNSPTASGGVARKSW